MPTYAYECQGCQNSFEIVQKMSDDPLIECELCGGALRKRMFAPGIVFKGSGFYVNDYAKKSESTLPAPTPAAKTESVPAAGDSGSSSTPAPAAPAATPAASTAPATTTSA